MIERLGQVIYWAFSGIAVLCFVFSLLTWGDKDLSGVFLGAIGAVVSWLFGRAVLYVLAGR